MNKTQLSKVFEISRSSLYWKSSGKLRRRYKKKEDILVLRSIKEVLRKRPTYGSPRVTAMINKDRASQGYLPYNHKKSGKGDEYKRFKI